MALGSGLAYLGGYPFEVRYSDGALVGARAAADVAASAYRYFSCLFSGVEPDIAVIVAGQTDWESRQPYGLPFFNDDDGQIRPGIVVMPAGSGDFWTAIGQDIRDASPRGYKRLLTAYPDGAKGVDLQPFFDLVTIHELGAQSRRLGARMRAEGYSTLEELEAHYTGGDQPMSALNYVWYQYRWLRLAARMFAADGESGLVRLWNCFHATDRIGSGQVTASTVLALPQVGYRHGGSSVLVRRALSCR